MIVTSSATRHTPATIQAPRWFGATPAPARAGRAPPAGVPHSGQNRDRAESFAPHEAHTAPPSGAPQVLQNLPVDSAPQAGHFRVSGLAIAEN